MAVSSDTPFADDLSMSAGTKTELRTILGIFLIGIIAWIGVGFYMATRQPVTEMSVSTILFEGLSSYWQQGYFVSLGAVLVLLLAFGTVRKWNGAKVVRSIIYYGLPPLLFLAVMWGFGRIYFSELVNNDAVQFYGTAIIIFYILGIVLGAGCIAVSRRDTLEIFLLLPLIGTLLLAGYAGYNLFTSTDFVYRNAFTLQVNKMQAQDGTIDVDATLQINKKGDYVFSASYINPYMMEPGFKNEAVLEWVQPISGEPGQYPMHISVKNTQAPANARMPIRGDQRLYFQISRSPKENGSSQFIKSISIPLEDNTGGQPAPAGN